MAATRGAGRCAAPTRPPGYREGRRKVSSSLAGAGESMAGLPGVAAFALALEAGRRLLPFLGRDGTDTKRWRRERRRLRAELPVDGHGEKPGPPGDAAAWRSTPVRIAVGSASGATGIPGRSSPCHGGVDVEGRSKCRQHSRPATLPGILRRPVFPREASSSDRRQPRADVGRLLRNGVRSGKLRPGHSQTSWRRGRTGQSPAPVPAVPGSPRHGQSRYSRMAPNAPTISECSNIPAASAWAGP